MFFIMMLVGDEASSVATATLLLIGVDTPLFGVGPPFELEGEDDYLLSLQMLGVSAPPPILRC